jgi:Putative auto-transporter adhesin, head GIN domain
MCDACFWHAGVLIHEGLLMLHRKIRLHAARVLTLFVAALAFVSVVPAADSAVVETRAASGFEAIGLEGDIDLVVRQGTRESVQVQAPAGVQPKIEVRVDGGTLRVGVKKGESLRNAGPVVVTVEVVNLRALASSGSGAIHVEPLKTPSLAVSLAGSGDATLKQLQTGALEINVAGSSDVVAAGSATRFKLSIAGSGNVQAGDLVSDEVAVNIAGSGNTRVNAAKSLSVAIAGSGNVDYSGNAVLSSSVFGSGKISRR